MQNTGVKRVRFWVYVRGWVLLTLKEGEAINFQIHYSYNEGYSVVSHRYVWSNGTRYIHSEIYQAYSDCDGPLGSGSEYNCDIRNLKSMPEEYVNLGAELTPNWWLKPARPNWEEFTENRYYRDIQAERAGY